MSRPIALIDYGAGNLASVRKGFAAAGAQLFTPASPGELARATGIVVPGVGNFAATEPLQHGWIDAVRTAIDAGTPLLGICLGLQWLFEGSEEAPWIRGLGRIPATCARLGRWEPGVESRQPQVPLKVPHVGWNGLRVLRSSRLLDGVPDGSFAYFTHSYAAPVTADCVATSHHGIDFAAVVERDNLFGVQFHPEKSGDAGIRILRNFVGLTA